MEVKPVTATWLRMNNPLIVVYSGKGLSKLDKILVTCLFVCVVSGKHVGRSGIHDLFYCQLVCEAQLVQTGAAEWKNYQHFVVAHEKCKSFVIYKLKRTAVGRQTS